MSTSAPAAMWGSASSHFGPSTMPSRPLSGASLAPAPSSPANGIALTQAHRAPLSRTKPEDHEWDEADVVFESPVGSPLVGQPGAGGTFGQQSPGLPHSHTPTTRSAPLFSRPSDSHAPQSPRALRQSGLRGGGQHPRSEEHTSEL